MAKTTKKETLLVENQKNTTRRKRTREEWEQIIANVKVSIKFIGPEEAKQLLHKGNKYNRIFDPKAAQALANKQSEGLWLFNGDPIKFNEELLLDGQHRLNAIILSGESIPFVMIEGIDPAAVHTYDIGKKRTFATMLQIDGEFNPNELSSAVNWMFLHKVPRATTSMEEKYAMLEEHPTLREAVEQMMPAKQSLRGASVGFLASTYYIVAKLDKKLADEVFFQVVAGEGMTPNVALLRQTIADISEKKINDKKYHVNSAFRQIWNASRAGKTLETIKFTLNIPEFK